MSKRAVIIGAGPAGLASAHCLAERNIEYVLLEQGPSVSAALRRVDPEMILLSPTALSRLPDMKSPPGTSEYLSFSELVGVLEQYQRQHDIRLITGARVVSVTSENGGFAVRYRTGEGKEQVEKGSHVINSTGIVSHPSLPPDFDPGLCSFRWLHSLDVRSTDLVSSRKLLVIGGGASAAEVLERWLQVRNPDATAWISLRRHLRAIPHWIFGIDLHYVLWLPEHLPTSLIAR